MLIDKHKHVYFVIRFGRPGNNLSDLLQALSKTTNKPKYLPEDELNQHKKGFEKYILTRKHEIN